MPSPAKSTDDTALRFASALSTSGDLEQAADEIVQRALEQLGGTPDLAVLFASHLYGDQLDRLPGRICRQLGSDRLIGCCGESIVGQAVEVEQQPALSLWLARLPGAQATLMSLEFERTADGGSIVGWPDALAGPWPDDATLLALGEPFSFPADWLLQRLNEDRPGVPVLGGMASGGGSPGDNRLFLGDRSFTSGAVACLLSGDVQVRSLVSQGCRPIGRPLVITRAERNVIFELGGKPALEQLQQLFAELPNREQQMIQRGLHVGRVVSEYQDRFEQGDFLVRNVVGLQPNEGAIVVGDYFRAGQTVQFHVRDQDSADAELRELLAGVRDQSIGAALLFTCNGRGTRMFDTEHHDAACVQEALCGIPLAGLFAQGEMGPIAGQNFLHGFTASLALFGPNKIGPTQSA
jgi:small ligand-binding sensory domain FIST